MTEDGFLRPTTLSLADSAAHPEAKDELKSLPEMFSTSGLSVSQLWATSQDGTRVPYFLSGNNKLCSTRYTLGCCGTDVAPSTLRQLEAVQGEVLALGRAMTGNISFFEHCQSTGMQPLKTMAMRSKNQSA